MAEAQARAKKKADNKGQAEHQFQAEVSKLLHLMVHSVYSEREVFLRELISNAADACDKLRYEAIARPDLLDGDPELAITISPDETARTLSVADNGIGMSRDELIGNLGTIARSGTQAFMQQAEGGEADLHLIGQFGIGFYSAFMVAERVEVISRKAGETDAHVWTSDGTGSFTVETYRAEDAPARGTRVRLTLREDAKEFLDEPRLDHVTKTYSDHIGHPIHLVPKEGERRQLNSASALWMRPKSEVTADQHKEFFGHVSGLYAEPALTLHYKAEGRHEYTVLLYVPGERPFDLYDPERRGRQKLYVRRVFITGDADLLPPYLRFVRGVIDSEDMPLNISREMLQDNPTVAQIRKAVTNRVLSELKKCAESDPDRFRNIWQAFGCVIKEGLYEDVERRDQLFDICRFRTTASGDETVTLKDYVARLKENQTAIYYLTADSHEQAARSPHLEGFRARGVEVLLLSDPVDSFWVRTALGFDGKPFKSVTQGAADLDKIALEEPAEESEGDSGATATFIAAVKQALGDKVSGVEKSNRLTSSPVCLVAGNGSLDRALEKMLARQSETGVTPTAPVLEVNAAHPLIVQLAAKAKTQGAGEIAEAAHMLLDQAYVLDGEPIQDPPGFAERLTRLMRSAYGEGSDGALRS